jgi:DNA-binding CsgD family transcriptional regulator
MAIFIASSCLFFMASIKKTIVSYEQNLQSISFLADAFDTSLISNLLQHFEAFSKHMPYVVPVFFVLDYFTKTYHVMTNNCKQLCGYVANDFLEGGIPFLKQIYQKEDYQVFNTHIFSSNVNCLQVIDPNDYRSLVFSYNFRITNGDKKIATMYQKSSFIVDTVTKKPIYSIGMVQDITDFKTDTIMQHTIEKVVHTKNGYHSQIIEKGYYYPYEEDSVFTKKEREILLLLADGFSSKQIAAKLFISQHTVVIHRKNLLKKSNTKNVAELIGYAIAKHII